MKIKILLLTLLSFTSCVNVSSQQDEYCHIFLEPILKVDLSIGSNKSDILNFLDNSIQQSGKILKYLPKDIDLYNGNKKITLPNAYVSDTEFILRFKNEKLVGYKVFIKLGDDYKYFWEIIEIIKKSDTNNINGFVYESDKKDSYSELFNNNDCKRQISVGRVLNENKNFQIKISVN